MKKELERKIKAAIAKQFGAPVKELEEQDPQEIQDQLFYHEKIRIHQKKKVLLKETIDNDSTLDLGDDTYTMAFNALAYQNMDKMELSPHDVHEAFSSAVFVFFIQMTLIFILALIVFQGLEDFSVKLPVSLVVLGARFVCSILMHM